MKWIGKPPGTSVHGISQARILNWVAMPSSRGFFLIHRSNWCLLGHLHWLAGRLFTTRTTWEALHKHNTPYSPTSPSVTGTEGKDSITTCSRTRAQGLWLQQTWEAGRVSRPQSHWTDNRKLGTVVSKKLLPCCNSSGPTTDSQPGDPAKGLRPPRELDSGGQWDLTTGLPRDFGNRFLESTDKIFCIPGPRRKEQWPHKRLSQTCLWLTVQEVSVEVWVNRGLPWGQTHWIHKFRHKSFCRRSPLPPLPLFGLRPNYREGTQPHPSTENGIQDLLSMALPIRARPRFPLQVPPIRKLPQASYSYLIEGRQTRNHNHTKLTKLITHGPEPCLTHWNYEPCRAGPPKMNWSWWKCLTKHGPLEKGMANHSVFFP